MFQSVYYSGLSCKPNARVVCLHEHAVTLEAFISKHVCHCPIPVLCFTILNNTMSIVNVVSPCSPQGCVYYLPCCSSYTQTTVEALIPTRALLRLVWPASRLTRTPLARRRWQRSIQQRDATIY